MAEGLELFQYYKGIGIGIIVGVGLAWLKWRLPVHVRTRHTRKLRQQVLDLRRIESAFVNRRWVPNPRELRVVRVPLRDRMVESYQVWRAGWDADTKPRTPKQIAEEAYQRSLMEAT